MLKLSILKTTTARVLEARVQRRPCIRVQEPFPPRPPRSARPDHAVFQPGPCLLEGPVGTTCSPRVSEAPRVTVPAAISGRLHP